MSTIKIIFLDWFGTLSTSLFWDHLREKDNEKYLQIQKCLFIDLKDFIDPWMIGEYTLEQIANKISFKSNLQKDFVLDGLKYSCQNMKFVSSNLLNFISQIRHREVKVVIATDNMDTFTRWTVLGLELDKHFDGILNSWDLKARKGDFISNQSLFFDKYLNESKVSPNECLIIDDSEDKENKIANYGIRYIKIEKGGLVPELVKLLSDF